MVAAPLPAHARSRESGAFLLFEEFQAEASTAQGLGGTGLDFAITRKLARIIRLAIDRSPGEIRCAR